jgi:Cu-Zn family superoxide dismutase
MSTRLNTTLALAVSLVVVGCAQSGNVTAPTSPLPDAPTGAPQGIARLQAADGSDAGEVRFHDTPQGVHLTVSATGLTPGPHGFHIHANGACAPGPDPTTGSIVAFGAAGGHFDPGHTRNHGRPGDPKETAHAGELPNLTADASGRASARALNANLTLAPGPASIMNRTVVVHAQADDYQTDPAGNSGPRVLCGVISPTSTGVVSGRTTFEGANVFPEGIAVDASNGDLYAGSVREGHLYRWTAGATQAELFQRGGSPGRQGAFGMKVDGQRRLWIAGGPNGTLAVVDLAGAHTEAVAKVPPGPQPFVNDLVVAGEHVYVTDSFRPVIYRASRTARPLALETWLDLGATPVRYRPNEINLNGIVASPDGRWLLAIQSVTGQLWRIDPQTRAVTEVPVSGGSLVHGDGLVLRGNAELYVVRNQDNEIAQVALASDWSRAQVARRLHDLRFKYPTTAVDTSHGLTVVNGQLNRQKDPPPLLPFDAVTVDLPR